MRFVFVVALCCVAAHAIPVHTAPASASASASESKNSKHGKEPATVIINGKVVEHEDISSEMNGFLNNVMDVISHPQNFFYRAQPDHGLEKGSETAKEEHSNKTSNHTTKGHDGFVEKTRDELKREIELLRKYLFQIEVEFDEWMNSNKHQNFKAMVIGCVSAVLMIVIYHLLRKCCVRRSRLNNLQSFANDAYSSKSGENSSLLQKKSTKRRGRFYSDDDEI